MVKFMDKELKNKFKTKYKQLNPEQKRAVDEIEGPVMVIAGPGTGKTHLLTMRIANILDKTDTSPEAILALTFTESGVASMRRDLIELIGALAYRVRVATFHGFSNDVIKNYPDDFPDIIGCTNISDVDQVQIIREIIDRIEFKNLRPFGSPYFYIRSIINAINELKKQGISPEEFVKITKQEEFDFKKIEDLYYKEGKYKGRMKGKYIKIEKHIIRNKDISIMYQEYQSMLHKSKFYDYSDMIMQVMSILKNNKELLLTLQEQYLYILVDEHQDTNSAQNKILELLANYHENPNLFIVGDEKQAIFRFQGASIENFLYFKNLYENVKLITLKRNYRSTQTILNAAHDLNSKISQLKAEKKYPETPIKLYAFSRPGIEQYFLAQDIKKLIKQGENPRQIAVLYRVNKDVIPLARIFEKSGVPFVIESDQDVLNDEDIKKLLIILKTIQKFGSAPELIELLHIDIFDILPLDVYKITKLSSQHINPYDTIQSTKAMKDKEIEEVEKLQNLYKKLSIWNKTIYNKNAIEAFEDVVRDSGFLSYILSRPSANEKIAKLHALFEQVKSFIGNHKSYTLESFLKYLDIIQEHNVLIKAHTSGQVLNSIHLMTAHKSKGLEFDYVYIVNTINGHWGHRSNFELIKLPKQVYSLSKKIQESFSEKTDEDERNLFYVAITRAKKQVLITYAEQNQDGKQQLPCQFIEEIKKEFIEKINVSQNEEEFNQHKDIEFAPIISIKPVIKEKSFLNQIFYEQGLSITALNNYIECPWKYFYKNLIRIPESQNKYLMLGTAVHAALKNYFDRFIREDDPGKEYLVRRFLEGLRQEAIAEPDYTEMLNKGKTALYGYYDHYHDSWENKLNIINEFDINGIEIYKNILIRGKIDKIEILDTSNNVNVIDYKTGKPKSRNEIEGNTKNSQGGYKRQLIFYNLLLNNFKNGKYKMKTGEIDFIEPNKSGTYKKEKFEISSDEIKEIKEQIKEVAQEIINLTFWDKTCDDPDCYYCNLRKIMKK